MSQTSLCTRVAREFRKHPNRWIPAPKLARVGGLLSWRTRVSDLRRAPFSMDIVNKVEQVNGSKHSYYCWKKAA